MFSTTRISRVIPFHAILLLLGAPLLWTCTDGGDPAGLEDAPSVQLTLDPELIPALAPDETRPIQRIRMAAAEAPGGGGLATATQDVDPGAGPWTVQLRVPVPTGATVQATISVELISVSTGSEFVEWSGRIGPITLRVGTDAEVQEISLVRGPLANLSVVGVAIQEPVPAIREGQALQLNAAANTTTPQDPPTLFWRSLNPGVATVSGTGVVTGVFPGTALIVATAGAVADTATVTVLPGIASVAVEPGGAVLDALGDEILFQAQVLDPRGDPIVNEAVNWAAADPGVLQSLGGGRFRALSRGATSVVASSAREPSVSGSAEVVVRQVVAAVEVLPEDSSVFVDETLQYEATALDANGNPISGMGFTWSTSNPAVATVTGTGLASGQAGGSVTIRAEADAGFLGTGGGGLPAPTPGTIGVATLTVYPEVARVVVSPSPFTFRSLNETRVFTARAMDAAGNELPVTDFAWSSANTAVVTVNSSGVGTAVANGSTVIRATARGVTGTGAVFVSQTAVSYAISPSSWVFSCPDIPCIPREFTGRALDALGNRVPGVVFYWESNDLSCFPVLDPTAGAAEVATVNDICGCDASSAQLRARLDPDFPPVATATLSPPLCLGPAPGEDAMCAASRLPPGSPFRLGTGLPF